MSQHLSSEAFEPFGSDLSPEEKKTLVSEVLEPEPWERFDGVFLGGLDQKLY